MLAKRSLLSDSSDSNVRWHGVKNLIDATNDFIEEHNRIASENTGYSKQVELMLQAVQEVVVIFDDNRVIEYANRAAEALFNSGKPMTGLRVDTSMRSLGLLEFLEQVALEYGGIARVNMGDYYSYLVSEPKLIKEVLVDNYDKYKKNAIILGRRNNKEFSFSKVILSPFKELILLL